MASVFASKSSRITPIAVRRYIAIADALRSSGVPAYKLLLYL